jgi:hypothetical protein
MFTGAAVVLDIPAPVGTAEAVKVTNPRLEGRHEQVAVKVETEPVANLFLHPGKTLPFELNEILAATFTVAVITTVVLKVATVAPPAS